eukprot:TRINITY_DN19316_c0_g1_i1.p1 TRINITY_DN19316_c0_g1~~TRINITY_DN19316_c0_g1_i1.p1  ORF type:complete len:192 (-),score=15.26 TRINITY_DN19316_c0_g1_i1:7-528(-)
MTLEWPTDQNKIAEVTAQYLQSLGQDQSAKIATLVKEFHEKWNSKLKRKNFVSLAAIFKDVFYHSNDRLHKYKGSVLKFPPDHSNQPNSNTDEIPTNQPTPTNAENLNSQKAQPNNKPQQQSEYSNQNQNIIDDLQPSQQNQVDITTTAGMIRNKQQLARLKSNIRYTQWSLI